MRALPSAARLLRAHRKKRAPHSPAEALARKSSCAAQKRGFACANNFRIGFTFFFCADKRKSRDLRALPSAARLLRAHRKKRAPHSPAEALARKSSCAAQKRGFACANNFRIGFTFFFCADKRKSRDLRALPSAARLSPRAICFELTKQIATILRATPPLTSLGSGFSLFPRFLRARLCMIAEIHPLPPSLSANRGKNPKVRFWIFRNA